MTTEAPEVPTVDYRTGDTHAVTVRRSSGDQRAMLPPLAMDDRTADLAEWLRGALADAYHAGRRDALNNAATFADRQRSQHASQAGLWHDSTSTSLDEARKAANALADHVSRAAAWAEAATVLKDYAGADPLAVSLVEG